MNLNPKVGSGQLVFLLLIIVGCIIFGWFTRDIYNGFIESKTLKEDTKEELEEDGSQRVVLQKEIKHEEVSPNGKNIIIKYNLAYDPIFYRDYYDDYFNNKSIISVKALETNKEHYLYTGDDRIGSPHWLGNDYVFFTSYCGTSCQGLYLVDTRDREVSQAVLSYLVPTQGDVWTTHFRDWFGQEFAFEGLVDEIEGKVDSNRTYLVFKMIDINRKPVGEKYLLFATNKLVQIK